LSIKVDREAKELLHIASSHFPELLLEMPNDLFGHMLGFGWLSRLGPVWHPGRNLGYYTLGEGTFAPNVRPATTPDGKLVVLKEYDLTKEKTRRTFRKELGLTLSVQHPCVMPVLAAFATVENTGLKGFLEMPRFSNTLADWMTRKRPMLSDFALCTVLRQVVQGLQQLHFKDVVHLDVKPSNIFVDHKTLAACIGDFDISLDVKTRTQKIRHTTLFPLQLGGTPGYMAPEVLRGAQDTVTSKTDMYSFGKVLQEALEITMQEATAPSAADRPPFPSHLVTAGRDLCRRLLAANPCDRPTSSHALADPFFNGASHWQLEQDELHQVRPSEKETLWALVHWGRVTGGVRVEYDKVVNVRIERAYQYYLAAQHGAHELYPCNDRLDIGDGHVLYFASSDSFAVSGGAGSMEEVFRRDLLFELRSEYTRAKDCAAKAATELELAQAEAKEAARQRDEQAKIQAECSRSQFQDAENKYQTLARVTSLLRKQATPLLVPDYWETSGLDARPQRVVTQFLIRPMQELLRKTAKRDAFGRLRNQKALMMADAEVTRVERIENPAQWAAYAGSRVKIRARHSQGGSLKLTKLQTPPLRRILPSQTIIRPKDSFDTAAIAKTYTGAGVLFYAKHERQVFLLLGHLDYAELPEGPHPWSDLGGQRIETDTNPSQTAAYEAKKKAGSSLGFTQDEMEGQIDSEHGVLIIHNEGLRYVLHLVPIVYDDYPDKFSKSAQRRIEMTELRWLPLRNVVEAVELAIERGTTHHCELSVGKEEQPLLLGHKLVDSLMIAVSMDLLSRLSRCLPSRRIAGATSPPFARLETDINEVFLWHGTCDRNMINILTNGSPTEHAARDKCMYGKGIYFAENSSKSLQYAGEQKFMFLCRVCLGDIFYTPETLLELAHPGPLNHCNDRFHKIFPTGTATYDSVVAKPGPMQNHKQGAQFHGEYVVFEGQQVYPEYVVYFK